MAAPAVRTAVANSGQRAMAAAPRAQASRDGLPPSSPYDAAVAPAGLTAAERHAAIVAVHLPDRPDLDVADCMAWVDALGTVLKARCPDRSAGIGRAAANARDLVQSIDAHMAAMWPDSEGNCWLSDTSADARPQGARASLEALLPTLQGAADAIEEWVCQSRLERLWPQDGSRVEIVTGSYREKWDAWLKALVEDECRIITAGAYDAPAAGEPGDGFDAVLARFDRAFEDCTDLERECSDAGLALLT